MHLKLLPLFILLSGLLPSTSTSAMEEEKKTISENRVWLISSYDSQFPASYEKKETKLVDAFCKDDKIDEDLVNEQLSRAHLDSNVLVYRGRFMNPFLIPGLISDNSMIFTKISLSSMGMTHFTSFSSYFCNLQSLDLSQNSLKNVKLDGMTQLRFLNICDNQLKSLNISHLSALQRLEANGNHISSMVLSNPKLSLLSLSDNPLKTLCFYRNEQGERLKHLNLDGALLENYNFLDQSPNLETLSLYGAGFTEIPEQISRSKNLKNLTISKSNLETLEGLPKGLQSLSAGWSHITSIRPLISLTELQTLDLTDNPISDIEDIKWVPYTHLRMLSINENLEEKIPPEVRYQISKNSDEYYRQKPKLNLAARIW